MGLHGLQGYTDALRVLVEQARAAILLKSDDGPEPD
jgi:hypothetical protein